MKKGGYIKRTKELYESLGLTPQSVPSLLTQLKRIEEGAISGFDRDRIKRKVRIELIAEKVEAGMGLQADEIIEIFGESFDDEYECLALSADEDESDNAMVQEIGANQEVNVDFLVGNNPLDMDPRGGLTKEVDTWKESDGSIRVLVEEEKDVLLLLRKVCNDGKWEQVPNLRAYDRRKVMKEVHLVDGLMHNLIRQDMSVTEGCGCAEVGAEARSG